MTDKPNVEDLDLTDAELMEVLKNHGIDRRTLLTVLGIGGGIAAFGGTATAKRGRGTRIDDVFGAPYASHNEVPSGLVDHVVELKINHGEGDHAGFPMVDSPEDGDFVPDSEADEFFFDPVGLHVKPGEIVHFKNVSHEHTVSAFHDKWANPHLPMPMRVPDGVPGFTSPPYVGGESWLYKFTKKGVYDVFCFPHIFLGMTMRLVVFDPEEDDLDDISDYPDLPPHPAFANADRVLNTPELDDPDGIVTDPDGEIAWSELTL